MYAHAASDVVHRYRTLFEVCSNNLRTFSVFLSNQLSQNVFCRGPHAAPVVVWVPLKSTAVEYCVPDVVCIPSASITVECYPRCALDIVSTTPTSTTVECCPRCALYVVWITPTSTVECCLRYTLVVEYSSHILSCWCRLRCTPDAVCILPLSPVVECCLRCTPDVVCIIDPTPPVLECCLRCTSDVVCVLPTPLAIECGLRCVLLMLYVLCPHL
jgi:hypothetical protein